MSVSLSVGFRVAATVADNRRWRFSHLAATMYHSLELDLDIAGAKTLPELDRRWNLMRLVTHANVIVVRRLEPAVYRHDQDHDAR